MSKGELKFGTYRIRSTDADSVHAEGIIQQRAAGLAETASIQEEVAKGVIIGIRTIFEDEEMVKHFWEQGFKELSSHSTAAAHQWIGRRILTWIVGVTTIAGLAYLFKNGFIK
tara:strand:+ start:1075 stop:1413 length:339 start_codon:yes stop_codon:yes gene_type:complete